MFKFFAARAISLSGGLSFRLGQICDASQECPGYYSKTVQPSTAHFYISFSGRHFQTRESPVVCGTSIAILDNGLEIDSAMQGRCSDGQFEDAGCPQSISQPRIRLIMLCKRFPFNLR